MTRFLEYFIPLFVAIDAFGLVPIFLVVTEGRTRQQRRRIIFEAVAVAFVISVSFMFLGEAIFRFLNIIEADFMIAGGIILLVLAVMDLLIMGKPAVHETEMVGIVPLAMPLIAGPATLTTVLVLATRQTFGDQLTRYSMTALSLALNFCILLVVLLSATRLTGKLGLNALRAFSKLVMVLLAAIAVNFIRLGILQIIHAK